MEGDGMTDSWKTAAWHAGRCTLASLFILAGINKILGPQAYLATMEGAGLPAGPLLLPAVIALELAGGLWLAIGRWYAWAPAFALAGFTLATNFVAHEFWTCEGERRMLELSLFFKNIAIMGGLIAVGATLARGAHERV
jgi:putative oxidoreductase